MDATDASAHPTLASRAPVHIGAVGLIVRDLDRVAAFYRGTIRLAELERTEARAPRVGGRATAEKFYRDGIGLDVTRRRTGAVFLSSGRYHHHVAANIWQSRGAGQRDDDRAGLAWFSFEAGDATTLEALGARLRRS